MTKSLYGQPLTEHPPGEPVMVLYGGAMPDMDPDALKDYAQDLAAAMGVNALVGYMELPEEGAASEDYSFPDERPGALPPFTLLLGKGLDLEARTAGIVAAAEGFSPGVITNSTSAKRALTVVINSRREPEGVDSGLFVHHVAQKGIRSVIGVTFVNPQLFIDDPERVLKTRGIGPQVLATLTEFVMALTGESGRPVTPTPPAEQA